MQRSAISNLVRSLMLAVLAASCTSDPTNSDNTPSALAVVSGAGQTGTLGSVLPTLIGVSVTTANGTPVVGANVSFQVSVGTASVSPASASTNAFGEASTQLTLGNTAGAVEVTAAVTGTTLTAKIPATALVAVALDCSTNALTLPGLGAVTQLGGTALCAPGGTTGAEYVLIPFNESASPLVTATMTVTPTEIDASVATARIATALAPLAPGGAFRAASPSGQSSGPADDFHTRLRASEAALAPRIAMARRWLSNRRRTTASLSVIPSTPIVGQLLALNANGDDACSVPLTRTGRIVAVTAKAIVIADTGNPAGGFSDAEYRSIGVTFDTLIDPVDRAAFGDPTDIDGNGRIVLFFTREVNALTPRNSNGSYVAGFFHPRDLFPTASSATLDGCTTSNVGEMFYLLVPDPNGTVNGNVFSKDDVATSTRSVTAHEYQHLINAARRIYVNTTATDFEEVWLNEGLSHIAEELLFYGETGLEPRQNLDVTALRASSRYVDAFNDNMLSNFGRYAEHLESPSLNSPYADDDELATRGATWSFLRYAVDRSGIAERNVWFQLANSVTAGRANLQQVFGNNLATFFRDWATSLIADDVTGAPATYQQASWNFRSIYSVLQTGGGYPLATKTLVSGVETPVRVMGGGTAFLRFVVGAGKTGHVQWGTLPSNVQLTLIRTR